MCLQVHSQPRHKQKRDLQILLAKWRGLHFYPSKSFFPCFAFSKFFRELQLHARNILKGKKPDFGILPNTAHCYTWRCSLRTRCWCANIQVAIILCLYGSLRGKYWSCPLVRVLLLRTDITDLEEFLRRAKKAEGCLQTLRMEEIEKVASSSLKSDGKRTWCHDTGSEVAGLG